MHESKWFKMVGTIVLSVFMWFHTWNQTRDCRSFPIFATDFSLGIPSNDQQTGPMVRQGSACELPKWTKRAMSIILGVFCKGKRHAKLFESNSLWTSWLDSLLSEDIFNRTYLYKHKCQNILIYKITVLCWYMCRMINFNYCTNIGDPVPNVASQNLHHLQHHWDWWLITPINYTFLKTLQLIHIKVYQSIS